MSSRTILLSQHGSGRASAYAEANKIVTFQHKTHVAWLDSVTDGFCVRIRTLDRQSNQWSRMYTIGAAYDNHGGPALTVDDRGFLHVVYYPHHPFRYRKSKRPNDASEWEEEIDFDEELTYPTLVCGPSDTLYLTARHRRKNQPWSVEQWTKRVGEDWQGPLRILRSSARGYSHFQEALAWSPDHQSLHLSCRLHADRGTCETVAYMCSGDFGKTWHRRDGSVIELPASPDMCPNTLSILGRSLRFGFNVNMLEEHAKLIAAAINKVDAVLGRIIKMKCHFGAKPLPKIKLAN